MPIDDPIIMVPLPTSVAKNRAAGGGAYADVIQQACLDALPKTVTIEITAVDRDDWADESNCTGSSGTGSGRP